MWVPTLTAPNPTAAPRSLASSTARFSAPRLVLAASLFAPLASGLALGGVGFFAVFPPVVAVSAVAAALAVAVLLVDKRWMAIVGAVASFVVLALAASDPTPGAITRPSLGLQMSWGHAARLAGLVGILAGIAEARRARLAGRDRLSVAVPYVALLALGLVVGIGATAGLAALDPGFAQGATVVSVVPDQSLSIVESDDAFSGTGNVHPGDIVRFAVDNRDSGVHSFTTRDGSVDQDTLAGRTTTILARAPAQAGDWAFFCKYHSGMTGVVHVA